MYPGKITYGRTRGRAQESEQPGHPIKSCKDGNLLKDAPSPSASTWILPVLAGPWPVLKTGAPLLWQAVDRMSLVRSVQALLYPPPQFSELHSFQCCVPTETCVSMGHMPQLMLPFVSGSKAGPSFFVTWAGHTVWNK